MGREGIGIKRDGEKKGRRNRESLIGFITQTGKYVCVVKCPMLLYLVKLEGHSALYFNRIFVSVCISGNPKRGEPEGDEADETPPSCSFLREDNYKKYVICFLLSFMSLDQGENFDNFLLI